MTFHVYTNPSRERCEEVAVRCPENPFMTGSDRRPGKRWGGHAHLLALEDAGEVQAGCLAFERSGYLTRSLEIMSLPLLTQPWMNFGMACRLGAEVGACRSWTLIPLPRETRTSRFWTARKPPPPVRICARFAR